MTRPIIAHVVNLCKRGYHYNAMVRRRGVLMLEKEQNAQSS